MAELDRLKEYHYRALRECERAGCWMTRDVYVEFNEEDVLALHDAIRDLDREIEAFTWERGLPAWEIWADGDDDCLERLFC
ncbi:hypothetical protein TruAng_011771 [Truncatella angustata]|nr:hypothetical protein TruAng_011771 [Truncatella angustata]